MDAGTYDLDIRLNDSDQVLLSVPAVLTLTSVVLAGRGPAMPPVVP